LRLDIDVCSNSTIRLLLARGSGTKPVTRRYAPNVSVVKTPFEQLG
jgi:hypothetical protein